LKNQARRASQSVILNIAEGCYREGKARLNHFRIAMGSAGETCAALDAVDLPGGAAMQAKLRRVVAMTIKLR
jgi:four helix bundle protein